MTKKGVLEPTSVSLVAVLTQSVFKCAEFIQWTLWVICAECPGWFWCYLLYEQRGYFTPVQDFLGSLIASTAPARAFTAALCRRSRAGRAAWWIIPSFVCRSVGFLISRERPCPLDSGLLKLCGESGWKEENGWFERYKLFLYFKRPQLLFAEQNKV